MSRKPNPEDFEDFEGGDVDWDEYYEAVYEYEERVYEDRRDDELTEKENE